MRRKRMKPRQVWTPETPWVKSNKKTQAYWPPYVCKNRNCKSYGKSHPNCKCGAPSFSQQSKNLEYDAHGGEVGSHHCDDDRAHHADCEHFADGGVVEENNELFSKPSLAVDHAVAAHGLLHALTKTGHSKSENSNKAAEDFIDHSRRGRKLMQSHASAHFDPKHDDVVPGKDEISGLKNHIDDIRTNPNAMLDTGGNLGLSAHSSALAAKAVTVSDYFEALKPKQPQPGPLDSKLPPSRIHSQNYDRQIGIAERPLSILGRVKNGTIQPADIQTLSTLYPDLLKSIQEKTFESLVAAKAKGAQIPYKQKMGLSMLLGQPLDSTMTQPVMQSIMQANAGAQTKTQGAPQGKSGATAETQKTIKGVDKLYLDPLQKIQAGK